MSTWLAIIAGVLNIVGWFIGKNADNKEMAELFFRWVDKIQTLYLKSAHLREDAKRRLEEIAKKEWVESP